MDSVFLADSFVKSFGQRRILKTATVWAQAGKITVLLGRNGSGKTTLLRCAMGLCRAEQGMVRMAGRVTVRPRLWRLAVEGLFYVPDRNLLSRRLRFREQLGLVQARFGLGDFREVLSRLEVDGLLESFPNEMSGGEKRRAELALAFYRDPSCLIADEPFTEVEPKDRALVAELLKAQSDQGTAILITGHDVEDLLAIADHVIWMTAGTTHGLGPPDAARGHDQFKREYLGPREA